VDDVSVVIAECVEVSTGVGRILVWVRSWSERERESEAERER
jgi:hypothetical protein